MKISDIKGQEILTTAGTSTVRIMIDVDGIPFSASAPRGTSKSVYESNDDFVDPAKNFLEETYTTVNQLKINQDVKKIKDVITNKDLKSEEIDAILSDMSDEKELNLSVILATSIATHRANDFEERQPFFGYLSEKINPKNVKLLTPLINIINGGLHTAFPTIAFQEILLVPVVDEKYQVDLAGIIVEAQAIFFELQKLLKKNSIFYGFGLEGGISAQWNNFDQLIDLLMEAMEKSDFMDNFHIGFDCAASTWFDKKTGKYRFFEGGKQYASDDLLGWYDKITTVYPVTYLEDPFAEHDYESWKQVKKMAADNSFLVAGDDLCATSVEHIEKQEMGEMIDAIIIKPSQAGTVSKTIDAIKAARQKDFDLVVSHRSCETEDNFIVDLIFASGARFCKLGNIAQGGITKYNALIELDQKISEIIEEFRNEKMGDQKE